MRIFVTFLAMFALAGCAYWEIPDMAEGTLLSTDGVLPGYGVIESVGVLRNARASAGSSKTAAPGDPNGYRLFLRMDQGFQTVDVDNGTFMAGEHVQITKDGRVVRITGTAFKQ